VTRPRIVVAPHVRELDTPLGRLRASILYDRFGEPIAKAGGQPLAAWPGTPDVDDLVALADGLVLVGGGDVAPQRFGLDADGAAVDLARDEFEVRLVLAAKERGTPLLGVCRGAQLLNIALGGTLRRVNGHRQPDVLARPSHSVSVVAGTRLADVLGASELEVNSFHDWAPDELGGSLRASAAAGPVTEGIESGGDWWALGIQWHLELLDDPAGRRAFDALVEAAAARTS
jgi:putative glutamine amidotransferase